MDDMGRKGLRNATLEGKKKKSNDFIKWLTDKDITKITVKDCNRYTKEVIGTNGLSSKTNKDTVTELTVLFKWFMTEGYIPTNPFIGMRGKLVTNTRGIWKEKRRAATEGELEEILRNLLGFRNKRVASMIVLGMYTGMRSNEIAEALRAEIYLDEIPYLKIMEGKSQAALREIPLHSIVKPIVESLVAQGKARDSQWLIQGLNPGGTDSKRNHYIVTAISSYLRTKAKVLDKNVVFHSLRKNFITALHLNKTEPVLVKQLTGHEVQDITFGL